MRAGSADSHGEAPILTEGTREGLEHSSVEQTVALDLRDMRLLRDFGARLVPEREREVLYEEILAVALALTEADAGTVQGLDDASHDLRTVATHGFPSWMSAYLRHGNIGAETSSATSLALSERTFVDLDLPELAGVDSPRLHLEAGFHSAQATPLVTRSGKVIGTVSTCWREPGRRPTERQLHFLDLLARQAADLLERHRDEERMRRSEAELKEAARRKDEFLSVLAHELRNPLAPIRTALELMRIAGDTPESVERVRAMLERQVENIVRLVDDLLDVSQITSGKLRLKRETTFLRSLVNRAVEASRTAIDAAQVDLTIDLPERPCPLTVDPTRFVQVLSNLLRNAIKFTERGGQIRIRGRIAESESQEPQLTLSVSDSGIGIPAELLPRVFELFVQGPRAAGPSGLGVGLALARRLMQMHGGEIEVHSDGPGRGSRFTLRLPLSSTDRLLAATAEGRPGDAPRRVAVIEDNQDAADTIAMLVSALGGEARIACNGEEGLRQVLEQRPDVVLLDIGLPGIDGYETCRLIRDALGDSVLVVALTGFGGDHDKERAAQAGFDSHLTKPADPTQLARLLSRRAAAGGVEIWRP